MDEIDRSAVHWATVVGAILLFIALCIYGFGSTLIDVFPEPDASVSARNAH